MSNEKKTVDWKKLCLRLIVALLIILSFYYGYVWGYEAGWDQWIKGDSTSLHSALLENVSVAFFDEKGRYVISATPYINPERQKGGVST